jgi:hypothetical protein
MRIGRGLPRPARYQPLVTRISVMSPATADSPGLRAVGPRFVGRLSSPTPLEWKLGLISGSRGGLWAAKADPCPVFTLGARHG